jgi:hypothetical protein
MKRQSIPLIMPSRRIAWLSMCGAEDLGGGHCQTVSQGNPEFYRESVPTKRWLARRERAHHLTLKNQTKRLAAFLRESG